VKTALIFHMRNFGTAVMLLFQGACPAWSKGWLSESQFSQGRLLLLAPIHMSPHSPGMSLAAVFDRQMSLTRIRR